MASVNQLISELAHSVSQPNNHALRENLRSAIIHTRNELIRRSYENHNYLDSHMIYRYNVSLIDVPDGDINLPEDIDISLYPMIKRTAQKVPRPVRLTNNLPFHRVSSVGYKTNKEIAYIKETSFRFTDALPGMKGVSGYDYINDYVYFFLRGSFKAVNKVVIAAAFEHPTEVAINNGESDYDTIDPHDNEWFIPEDMIGQLKEIIIKRDLLEQPRQTDEVRAVELTR